MECQLGAASQWARRQGGGELGGRRAASCLAMSPAQLRYKEAAALGSRGGHITGLSCSVAQPVFIELLLCARQRSLREALGEAGRGGREVERPWLVVGDVTGTWACWGGVE